MQTYITILRGINVSGHKKIIMNDLKVLLSTLGFENIRTYIQSGNVIFQAAKANTEKLAAAIEKDIKTKYEFEVPVLVLTQTDLKTVIDDNPFLKEKGTVPDKLHITFLADTPEQENIEKLSAANYEPDKFKIKNKAVYIYCPNGYGNTKLTNTFFENKLKVTATTRNWKTVNTLAELAAEA